MKEQEKQLEATEKQQQSKIKKTKESSCFLERICKLSFKSAENPPSSPITPPKKSFKHARVWFIVLLVYLSIFSYTGYIAFWPMDFNDPNHNVKKYYEIFHNYNNEFEDEEASNLFNSTLTELAKEAESEADDMQQLASQSFNIVLGAFLAFLSATVTTIFQGSRK